MRKIIHIDMDAFFASIEQRERPELRGKPLAVGHPRAERAVVAAASYEARRYGVRSAMPMVRAWQLCPHLEVVRPRFALYREVSAQLRAILEDYTPLIEPLSLDECYMDVTEDLRGVGSATWIAEELRERVRGELGLTASVGASSAKFVAKLASDHRKPDGLTVVPPEAILDFIHPQPVEVLWGVGPATARTLRAMGLHRVRDVARCDVEKLRARLGKRGVRLYEFANGRDPRGVVPSRERKQRGIERTFSEDLSTAAQVLEVATAQLERLALELSRAGEQARCLTLKLRHDDFTTLTRSFSVTEPTARVDRLADTLAALVARTEAGQRPVRLVGVSVSGLVRPGDGASDGQLSLSL